MEEHLPSYISYLADHGLFICVDPACGYAVLPSQLLRHIKEKHHTNSLQQRQQVTAALSRIEGLVRYMNDVRLPTEPVEQYDVLPLWTDGLQCIIDPTSCNYICRTIGTMGNHAREYHTNKTPNGDRDTIIRPIPEPQYRTSVHCQQLFRKGPKCAYFEVYSRSGPVPPQIQLRNDRWAQFTVQALKQQEEHTKIVNAIIDPGEADEISPWLQRTQWPSIFATFNREELQALIKQPDKTDQEGLAIWDAVGHLVVAGQYAVQHRVSTFIRFAAIVTEKNNHPYTPLQPYMYDNKLSDYIRPWQQIIMFIYRTRPLESRVQVPRHKLSKTQKNLWIALRSRALQQVEEGQDSTSSSSRMSSQRGSDTRTYLTDLQIRCLVFCVSLLDVPKKVHEYKHIFILALGVLGIKENRWSTPQEFTPILSAIIKTSRYMVILKALYEAGEDTSSSSSGDEGSLTQSPGSQAKIQGTLALVERYMESFMIRGTYKPINWILDLRAYGMKISFNTTSPGYITWAGEQLLYKQLQVKISNFRGFVHSLVSEARKTLFEDLLLLEPGEKPPGFEWGKLRDNPSNQTAGWNFLNDPRYKWPVNGGEWLFHHIRDNEKLKQRFLAEDDTEDTINQKTFKLYTRHIASFREKLLILMHVTGGQPARSPEILSSRHKNTAKGEHRNIYIEDGYIVFVTRYHKGYTLSGDVKIIHRYLPADVGELLIWYQWLALPFFQAVGHTCSQAETAHAHLWPTQADGRRWDAVRMRKCLERETEKGLGQAINISAYRHISIALSRKYIQGHGAFRYDDDDLDGDWEEGTTNNEDYDMEQAGHTSHVSGLVYARGMSELAGSIYQKRTEFRQHSIKWHDLLGFTRPTQQINSGIKRPHQPDEQGMELQQMQRFRELKGTNIHQVLERMLGTEARFREGQETAIQAIIAREPNILCVMPTGGGKSLLFMLPAMSVQGGTTIVIVPLNALRTDLKKRCTRLGINCFEWGATHQSYDASIVLITPEAVDSDSFFSYINRLRNLHQLDRIVIDECHMIVAEDAKFRRSFAQLGNIAMAHTQVILLTATLPTSMVGGLIESMYWTRETTTIVRRPTVRKNIRYSVVVQPRGPADPELGDVIDTLQAYQQKLAGEEKMIVYAATRSKTERIAKLLSCTFYHAGMSGSRNALESFVSGNAPMIVTTSALGMGLDIPNIRVVVHVDRPRSLLEFAQESGRAGRDGLPSQSIIIGTQESLTQLDGLRAQQGPLISSYLQVDQKTRTCRRAVLDSYLDGDNSRTKCTEDEALCDVCSPPARTLPLQSSVSSLEGGRFSIPLIGTPSSKRSRENSQLELHSRIHQQSTAANVLEATKREEAYDIDRALDQVVRWADRCAVCEAAGRPHLHRLADCTSPDSTAPRKQASYLSTKVKFMNYSACFGCHLPQRVCPKFSPMAGGRGWKRDPSRPCEFNKDVMWSALTGIIHSYPSVKLAWQQRLAGVDNQQVRVDVNDDNTIHTFLGMQARMSKIESANLIWEFLWVTEHI